MSLINTCPIYSETLYITNTWKIRVLARGGVSNRGLVIQHIGHSFLGSILDIQFNVFDVYLRDSMTFVNKQNNAKGHQGRRSLH